VTKYNTVSMKKLIVATTLSLVAVGAMGQGMFTFANKNVNSVPVIDARVSKITDAAGTSTVSGAAFMTQCYVKLATAGDESFAPVGSAVNFRTGASGSGYIVPVVVTTTYAGGTPVTVEMRAWEAAAGTWDAASTSTSYMFGKSKPVNLTVTVAPSPPADMAGLAAFTVQAVPEPSILTLGALGVVGFLLRRRS